MYEVELISKATLNTSNSFFFFFSGDKLKCPLKGSAHRVRVISSVLLRSLIASERAVCIIELWSVIPSMKARQRGTPALVFPSGNH